jgi:hypothetical protein
MDLEIAIQRGDSPRAQSVLDEIRSEHISEPGIAEATYRLLYSAGLISPRAGRNTPTQLAMPATRTDGSQAPTSRSGLWTPGGEDDVDAPAEGKSVIWTP